MNKSRWTSKPIEFKGNGVEVKATTGNVLEIKVTEPDFHLTAIGFDVHRDLFVRIDEADSEQDHDAEKGDDE